MDSVHGHLFAVIPENYVPSNFSVVLSLEYFRLYPLYFMENVNYWTGISNIIGRRIASIVHFHYKRGDANATSQDVIECVMIYDQYLRLIGALLVALLVLFYLILIFFHDTDKEEFVVVYKYGEALPFPELVGTNTSFMLSPPPAPVKTSSGLGNRDLSPKTTPLKSTNFAGRQKELDYEVS